MNKFYFEKKFGFSLVEVLIVIGVITILCGICVPIYSQHLVKSQRVKAEMVLDKLAVMLERYYVEHDSYAGMVVPQKFNDRYYRYVVKSTTQGYLLVAVPVGRQAERDKCGVISLDDKGNRHCAFS